MTYTDEMMKHYRLRYVPMLATVVIVYFTAAVFGLSLSFTTRSVTAVWPPAGIALAAFLLFGYRAWPGVLIASFASHVVSRQPIFVAGSIAAGDTLAAFAGAYVLNRFIGFDELLNRTKNVMGLIAVALSTATINAAFRVIIPALAGMIRQPFNPSLWLLYWLVNAAGILTATPFFLTWAKHRGVTWKGWRLVECAALFISLSAVSWLVFFGNNKMAYYVFPFLIWAALRFSQREAVTASSIVAAIAAWGAMQRVGPFSSGTLDVRLITLDLFVGVTGVTALLLGAVTAEREQARRRSIIAREELEDRVLERTSELAQANTELMKLNERLSRRTTELAEKSEEVEAFVYTVSHDLRAPLVNLQGFSKELERECAQLKQFLESAALPEKVEDEVQSILNEGIPGALRYISASTTKFQRLIDALLRLSRSGRQEYRSEEVDTEAVVGATLDSMRDAIKSTGAVVSVQSLPPAVGDPTAIDQVFSNLIGNALKYLDPGRPGMIEVGGERKNGMVHYWVRDNGAGIPASASHRLFQVFQRFHPKLASGEGMGLAIVKRVVERHGGKVWAESQEGRGTEFHVTLPGAVHEQRKAS